MTVTTSSPQVFITRVAQSVTHRIIPDRLEADRLGRLIAEFALKHWEALSCRYGSDGADEFEIVERFTHDALELRRAQAEAALRIPPPFSG